MLSERISLVMNVINADNTVIAEIAGFDQSNVSRMRSGARTPVKSGTSIRRFVDAVLELAGSSGGVEKLCSLIGYSGEISGEKLRNALLDWLYDDTAVPEKKHTLKAPEAKLRFGQKLDQAIKAVGISNSDLSKLVNVDPSYLSRMRNGKYLPNNRSKVLEQICVVLINRVAQRNEMAELSEAVSIPSPLLESEPKLLMEWMLDSGETPYKAPVGQLLNSIAAVDFDREMPVPQLDQKDFGNVLSDRSEHYRGIEGIRAAVLRFLCNNLKTGRSELMLYSDQSMEWMNGDYHMKWLTLMAGVLKSGTRIRIIHNIQRSSTELLEAIASWLPLYMSGMILPFYSTRELGERFSHTMFLDPGRSCIKGSCVRGLESKCGYDYITDPETLEFCSEEFGDLLASSRPLVKISRQVTEPAQGSIQRTYGNVRLEIRENEAVLSKLSEPVCSFTFDHPLLMIAFRSYIV